MPADPLSALSIFLMTSQRSRKGHFQNSSKHCRVWAQIEALGQRSSNKLLKLKSDIKISELFWFLVSIDYLVVLPSITDVMLSTGPGV